MFIGTAGSACPTRALFAFALGCDMVNVGREAMLAIGCIQAQRCHTGALPDRRGDAATAGSCAGWTRSSSTRARRTTCARCAPSCSRCRARWASCTRRSSTPEHLEIVGDRYTTARLEDVFGYDPAWRALSPERIDEIESLIGPPDHGPTQPGPEGGPIAGDEAAGPEDSGDEGMAGEGTEAGMAAGGD